jgi:hypothetical protein
MKKLSGFFMGPIMAMILIFTSCKKEDSDLSDGLITGFDYRECVCCGGIFIDIDATTYRFQQLPDNSNLVLEEGTFPVKVSLRWKKDDIACMGDEIIVEYIVKR